MPNDSSNSDSERKIREAAKRAAEKVDTDELPPGCPVPLHEAIRRVFKAPPLPPDDDESEPGSDP
jgi:hypothetical protein